MKYFPTNKILVANEISNIEDSGESIEKSIEPKTRKLSESKNV